MSCKRAFKRIIPIFTLLILTFSCQPQTQSRHNNLGDMLELREELAKTSQSDMTEQTSNSESVKISQEKTETAEFQSVPEIDEQSPSSLSAPKEEKLIPYDIDTSDKKQEEIPVEVLDAGMIYYYESESDSNPGVVYPRLQTD